MLAIEVSAAADERIPEAPPRGFALVFIGLTIAVLIPVIAPLTAACFEPTRDFGPRFDRALTGRGTIILPGPRGYGFVSYYHGPGCRCDSWFWPLHEAG